MGSSFFSKYRDPIVVFLLLIAPAIFYIANSKETRDHNIVDRGLLAISAPIQWVIVSSISAVSDVWHQYIALVNLQERNTYLFKENRELRRELLIRREQALENSRLRRLLNLREQSSSIDGIVATVVSMSPTPMYRRVRIDRGSENGVVLGAGVVNHDGIVGRVIATGASWSDVMLLVDVNCSVDVVVQRTRALARVRGYGGDRRAELDIQCLVRTADVEPGDILVTSGLGTIFPKGLEVGEITMVERGTFGLYQQVDIRPAANFAQLETVMVLVPHDGETFLKTPPDSLTSTSNPFPGSEESATP